MPSNITYAPERGTLLVRVVGCFAFAIVAGCIAIAAYAAGSSRVVTSAILVACGGYFAVVGGSYIAALFDRAGLIIDATGFSYRALWRRRRFAWADVAEFKVVSRGVLRLIAFEFKRADESWQTRVNRQSIGVSDFVLAHNFNAPVVEVCRVLNEYRDRALAAV